MVLLNDFKLFWKSVEKEVLGATKKVGKSGFYVLSDNVKKFETKLAHIWNLKNCTGCGNGLDAIEIGLRALGIKEGEKVLTTPLSAYASTLAIIRAGGVPVFIDIDHNGLINLDLAQKIISKHKIKFMVPVHLYGLCLDLEHLKYLKNKFNLKIVEDCAQSVLSSHKGKLSGTIGQVAATSFYPTKNLGCLGDGGAILTNNSKLDRKFKILRNYGENSKYNHQEYGLNSRLDELQAAIMINAILPKLRINTKKRIYTANYYNKNIDNSKVKLIKPCHETKPVWHIFPVLVKNRKSFQNFLASKGIQSAIHYPTLITKQKALKKAKSKVLSKLTNADNFVKEVVSIPIHPYLKESEMLKIVRAINSWKK